MSTPEEQLKQRYGIQIGRGQNAPNWSAWNPGQSGGGGFGSGGFGGGGFGGGGGGLGYGGGGGRPGPPPKPEELLGDKPGYDLTQSDEKLAYTDKQLYKRPEEGDTYTEQSGDYKKFLGKQASTWKSQNKFETWLANNTGKTRKDWEAAALEHAQRQSFTGEKQVTKSRYKVGEMAELGYRLRLGAAMAQGMGNNPYGAAVMVLGSVLKGLFGKNILGDARLDRDRKYASEQNAQMLAESDAQQRIVAGQEAARKAQEQADQEAKRKAFFDAPDGAKAIVDTTNSMDDLSQVDFYIQKYKDNPEYVKRLLAARKRILKLDDARSLNPDEIEKATGISSEGPYKIVTLNNNQEILFNSAGERVPGATLDSAALARLSDNNPEDYGLVYNAINTMASGTSLSRTRMILQINAGTFPGEQGITAAITAARNDRELERKQKAVYGPTTIKTGGTFDGVQADVVRETRFGNGGTTKDNTANIGVPSNTLGIVYGTTGGPVLTDTQRGAFQSAINRAITQENDANVGYMYNEAGTKVVGKVVRIVGDGGEYRIVFYKQGNRWVPAEGGTIFYPPSQR